MTEECALSVADIDRYLKARHPGLAFRSLPEGGAVIMGSLRLARYGVPFESFLIEILLSGVPASQPPRVFEIGGRIPRLNSHHVNSSDGSLCLGVPEEIWLLLQGRYEISRFIEEVLEPYLLGVSCNLRGEPWPFGERSHGAAGLIEFYSEHFGTKDPTRVLDIIDVLLAEEPKGHWLCPCGGGKVIRRCHRDTIRELRSQKFPATMLQRSASIIAGSITSDLNANTEALQSTATTMRRLLARRAAA